MEDEFKYKINCPFCGKRILKIGFGSKVEVECYNQKCKELLIISIKKNRIIIESSKLID